MKATSNFLRSVLSAVLVATVATAHADEDPLNDPVVQKTLRAMNDASTWYHPDLFGEFAGMHRYADHNYAGAMKYFEIGAYYADKLSQLNIGLMYLNGEGIDKNPVNAFAWISIAAERDYADFVATRDRVKATLTPEQFMQAETLRAKLAEKYADVVAKPRMEKQLRLGRAQMTGSRLGTDFGVYHATVKNNCRGGVVVDGMAIPEAGCGGSDIYAPERWQPEKYFAQRDSQWKATVTVGDIQKTETKIPAQ